MQEQVSQLQIATAELALQRSKAHQQVTSLSQEINWLQSEDNNGPTDEEIEMTVIEWTAKKKLYLLKYRPTVICALLSSKL